MRSNLPIEENDLGYRDLESFIIFPIGPESNNEVLSYTATFLATASMLHIVPLSPQHLTELDKLNVLTSVFKVRNIVDDIELGYAPTMEMLQQEAKRINNVGLYNDIVKPSLTNYLRGVDHHAQGFALYRAADLYDHITTKVYPLKKRQTLYDYVQAHQSSSSDMMLLQKFSDVLHIIEADIMEMKRAVIISSLQHESSFTSTAITATASEEVTAPIKKNVSTVASLHQLQKEDSWEKDVQAMVANAAAEGAMLQQER